MFGQHKAPASTLTNQFQFPQTGTNTNFGGSSLFGQTTQNQQQPSPFGQPPQQSQSQSTLFSQPQTNSINTSFNDQNQQNQSSMLQPSQSNLFGQSQSSSGLGQSQKPNFFNSSAQPSMFGSKPTQPSLFGQPPANPMQSSSLGSSQTQPQSGLTRITRHSDLSQDAQKFLDQFDNHVMSQSRISADLAASHSTQDELVRSIPNDVKVVERKLYTTHTLLQSSLSSANGIREISERNAHRVLTATRLIDLLRTPGSRPPAGDVLLSYFMEVGDEAKARLHNYAHQIIEIERFLSGVENPEGVRADAVKSSLENLWGAFMAVVTRVAQNHDGIQRMHKTLA